MKQITSTTKPIKSQVYGGGNSGQIIAGFLAKLPLRFHKTIQY